MYGKIATRQLMLGNGVGVGGQRTFRTRHRTCYFGNLFEIVNDIVWVMHQYQGGGGTPKIPRRSKQQQQQQFNTRKLLVQLNEPPVP